MVVNCKACGKEIGKGVKKCIHCGADQRNFFSRHKIITAVLVVVVLVIIGSAISSGSKSSTSVAMTASSPVAPVKTQTPAPAPLSKQGVSSNVTIAVKSFESADSVGNQFTSQKAQGVFKIVTLNITNNQKDAITVDTNSFKLIDVQNREFSASTEGQTALQLSGKEAFFLEKVNPGVTAEGQIVFDVPKDAKGFKLKARGGVTGQEITLAVQ